MPWLEPSRKRVNALLLHIPAYMATLCRQEPQLFHLARPRPLLAPLHPLLEPLLASLPRPQQVMFPFKNGKSSCFLQKFFSAQFCESCNQKSGFGSGSGLFGSGSVASSSVLVQAGPGLGPGDFQVTVGGNSRCFGTAGMTEYPESDSQSWGHLHRGTCVCVYIYMENPVTIRVLSFIRSGPSGTIRTDNTQYIVSTQWILPHHHTMSAMAACLCTYALRLWSPILQLKS